MLNSRKSTIYCAVLHVKFQLHSVLRGAGFNVFKAFLQYWSQDILKLLKRCLIYLLYFHIVSEVIGMCLQKYTPYVRF